MSSVNVVWLNYHETAPARGYWCYGWLEEVFDNTVSERHTFYWGSRITDVPETEGAIVVIPAEYNAEYVDQINADLRLLPWAVVILASDERGIFPVERLEHDGPLWVMTPHFESHTYRPGTQFMGEMYPPHARQNILNGSYMEDRAYRWSFSGQITHQRRYELVETLRTLPHGYLNETEGFTQGLDHRDYYELMANTVVVPAPSGPVTPDSFRAFEALEAGAVPILDLKCPVEQDGRQYWDAVFGIGHPLPTVSHWPNAVSIIEDVSDSYPSTNNRIYAWWQLYKRELLYRILDCVPTIDHGDITVLIPTSPIPSHPSMEIIEKTIESVRFHHPTADILIMIDGVRDEQLHRLESYERYVQELLDACAFRWENVYPIYFETHQHQANMTRAALDYVRTPTILFVEHDTPLVTDLPFDWTGIVRIVSNSAVDSVRFHYEGRIHPEHEHLMVDPGPVLIDGVPVRRTVQWSQRPHLARTDYYRALIHEHFPPTGCTMIEDRMHSVAQEFHDQHRLAIYHPEGTIVRSTHLDGRECDPKYDMRYE